MEIITLKRNNYRTFSITQRVLMVLSFLIVLSLTTGAGAVIIEPEPYDTLVIDVTGAGCSMVNGTWTSSGTTATCTLTEDIDVAPQLGLLFAPAIEINGTGITLDGDGHTLGMSFGASLSSGILLSADAAGATVKNLTVQGFDIGIHISSASGNTIYNNNFIGNATQARVDGGGENVFDLECEGGNYWNNLAECDDSNPANGVCDAPYVFEGGQDNSPWAAENGWEGNSLCDSVLTVPLDIKPGSCPNPVNVRSKGVIPVAVLGTYTFDVRNINPLSLRLEGVTPIRSAIVDVATPYDANTDNDGCNELGDDGYEDLVLKFKTGEIVEAVGEVADGDIVPLTLIGELIDETSFTGSDIILIKKKGKSKDKELKKAL